MSVIDANTFAKWLADLNEHQTLRRKYWRPDDKCFFADVMADETNPSYEHCYD